MNRPAPHELVRAVRAELAVPGRYHLDYTSHVHRSWLQLALQWLGDRYGDFIRALESHMHVGPRGVSVIGDLLIAIAVLLIAVAGARLLVALDVRRSRRARTTMLLPPRSATALARQARDAADAGEYSRAVRLLFAAAVTLLDLRGVIHDDSSATVNDLRREARMRGDEVGRPFADVARAFTAAAYAEESLDASSWERARSAYERLTETVRSE